LLFCCRASVSLPPPMTAGHLPPLPFFLDAGDARADASPVWAHETAQETTCRCGRLSANCSDSFTYLSETVVHPSLVLSTVHTT
jgi:hypothetical protein